MICSSGTGPRLRNTSSKSASWPTTNVSGATQSTDNVPVSLFHPIRQAVTRKNPRTGETIGAGQSLSRLEALRCATANGAWLSFDESKKGSLEPGKYADLAVLSGDYFDEDAVPDEAIKRLDRKSTRLNSSHMSESRMPSSA